MNTIHETVDPVVNYESMRRAQYCAPHSATAIEKERAFHKFMATINPMWEAVLAWTEALVEQADDEVLEQISLYKRAGEESALYRPLKYLVDWAMDTAQRSNGFAGIEPLRLMDTHNKNILGCAVPRR